MEQDVIVLFFTIIFAFLPAVSVTAGDIYYKSPLRPDEITGSTPDIPYSSAEDGSSGSIKIPILWWVVHQASVGFVELFIAGVNSFGESTHIRAIGLALNYAQLNDPQLQAELQLFRPALLFAGACKTRIRFVFAGTPTAGMARGTIFGSILPVSMTI